MASQAYRHKITGHVIAVAEGSDLAELVEATGNYELAELDELHPADAAATSDAALGSVADRDETPGGWVTAPGTPPAPITATSGVLAGPATTGGDNEGDLERAAILAKAYEVNTVEGVNGYLDEHPEAVELVLAEEQAGQARKGIVEGRHAQPATTDEPAAPAAE